MSNCPNCGAAKVRGAGVWQCGTQHESIQTRECRILQLERDLRQANAVIDAINTLTENRRTSIEIRPSDFDTITVRVKDNVRTWCGEAWRGMAFGDTLREALERCIAARDQHDREAG